MKYLSMCVGAIGEVLSVEDGKVMVKIVGKKVVAKPNPHLKIQKGDEVVVFKGFVLEKVK